MGQGGVPCPKPRPRALDKRVERRAKLDHYLEERQKAFTRDRKTCRVYDTAAVETHHVIPRSLGGSDDQDNLLSVSKKAHDEFTRNVLKTEGSKNADGPVSIVKWSDANGGGYVPFKVSAPPDGKAAA